MLFRDEVFAIVGAAMDVHSELGSGFLEAVYQEAFEKELSNRQIPFDSQCPIAIFYKGVPLNKKYKADFICYDGIMVEIKAINKLSGVEKAQLLNYLKATGLKLGLLINFGSTGRLEWKRFIREYNK